MRYTTLSFIIRSSTFNGKYSVDLGHERANNDFNQLQIIRILKQAVSVGINQLQIIIRLTGILIVA